MLKLVHPIKDSIHLADYIHVFQDKTEQLTIDNIRTQTFKPLSKASLTEISAFLRYRVWLKFGVENTHTDTITLSFNLADYDSVTVYQIRNNQQLIPLTIGTFIKKHPQPEKTIYPSTTTLLVHFPPKSRILFYCRASGYPSDFGIRPIFFNPTAEVNFFWQDLIIAYSWNITFLSILLFVFITSLANYFQLRHKAFLYYCGYIATHFIFFWRGFIANDQFIDWGSHWLLPYYWRTPFAWGWSIFYILFIDSFLETRIHYPKAHRFLRLLFLVFLSAIVTAQILLAIDPYTGYQYIRFTRFFNSFIGLFLFFYMFIVLKDSSLGRYITIGSLCYTQMKKDCLLALIFNFT
ncbi:MAG: hypothetical protein JNL70_06160 [Saprospiraceae bacterium]|nr:hypothetical protein [Saprospiraceae bacterium]